MSTIKHGPLYLTKRLRDRMDAAGMPRHVTIGIDMAYGPDRSVEIDHREPSPRDDLMDASMYASHWRRYDNPAWPDLSERFTPTMAGLPEPEPEFTAWRKPWFWSVLLTYYALVIALICLIVGG